MGHTSDLLVKTSNEHFHCVPYLSCETIKRSPEADPRVWPKALALSRTPQKIYFTYLLTYSFIYLCIYLFIFLFIHLPVNAGYVTEWHYICLVSLVKKKSE